MYPSLGTPAVKLTFIMGIILLDRLQPDVWPSAGD